jgi:hypothetical protein
VQKSDAELLAGIASFQYKSSFRHNRLETFLAELFIRNVSRNGFGIRRSQDCSELSAGIVSSLSFCWKSDQLEDIPVGQVQLSGEL